MKRFLATLENDMRLQWRNGFYAVTALVVVFFLFLSRQNINFDFRPLMGAFLIGNLLMTGFYFVAGLLLLERNEGTVLAQVISPLRYDEYLASKVISLFILALLESLAITFAFIGLKFDPTCFLCGLLFAFALNVFLGLAVVTRYESINQFLLPSIGVSIIIMLPVVFKLFQLEHWLIYLHPLQPLLLMVNAAFVDVPVWQLLYALPAGLFWVVLSMLYARHCLRTYLLD